MSDLTISVSELYELARGFEGMARTLHQGDAGTYFEGAAQAYQDAALALRMLAAVRKAEEVLIPIPGDPEYRQLSAPVRVSPDVSPLEGSHAD